MSRICKTVWTVNFKPMQGFQTFSECQSGASGGFGCKTTWTVCCTRLLNMFRMPIRNTSWKGFLERGTFSGKGFWEEEGFPEKVPGKRTSPRYLHSHG